MFINVHPFFIPICAHHLRVELIEQTIGFRIDGEQAVSPQGN